MSTIIYEAERQSPSKTSELESLSRHV